MLKKLKAGPEPTGSYLPSGKPKDSSAGTESETGSGIKQLTTISKDSSSMPTGKMMTSNEGKVEPEKKISLGGPTTYQGKVNKF